VVDVQTGQFTCHDNSSNLTAVQGAGIQAARRVVELRARALVTGHVGPKAFATLAAGNVDVFVGATGSVADALEQFKAGRLKQADKANVEGHWV